jgi:hypothetical protein
LRNDSNLTSFFSGDSVRSTISVSESSAVLMSTTLSGPPLGCGSP